MKTTKHFFAIIAVLLLLSFTPISAQDEPQPRYYTVTTMYFNMNNDTDANWVDVEKEYLEKVTNKNEYILGAGFYTHLYTDDSSELRYVQVFGSWEDIEKAGQRNNELIQEAWPDEAARDAFFKTQNSFYRSRHSDEIYSVMRGSKPFSGELTNNSIVYIRTSYFANPEDGKPGELRDARAELLENVINKNEYIKGYYPHRHYYGSNSNQFVEAFFLDSVDDLDDMNRRSGELFMEHWTTDESRKAMGDIQRKYFRAVHGDAILSVVPELRK